MAKSLLSSAINGSIKLAIAVAKESERARKRAEKERIIAQRNSEKLRLKAEKYNDSRIRDIGKLNDQWNKNAQKDKHQASIDASLRLAEDRTKAALFQQECIENILICSLGIYSGVDWESLKNKEKFEVTNPKNELVNRLSGIKTKLSKIEKIDTPEYKPIPDEPQRESFTVELTFFDKLFKSQAQKKKDFSYNQYLEAMSKWRDQIAEIEQENKNINWKYQECLKKAETQKSQLNVEKVQLIAHYDVLEENWKKSELDFYEAQQVQNVLIDRNKSLYFEHEIEAVTDYCNKILNNSKYPDFMPKYFDLDYNNSSKLLLVDYSLPIPESFPTLNEVRYLAAKKTLKECHLTENQISIIYDNTIYKIILRILHELFEADQANAIDLIVLNGWVSVINKATGKNENNCIVSIQVKKNEFIEIELNQVDSKACFKKFKGISCSKLSGITAVRPIIQINKSDKRFISSYSVVDEINEGVNLALMDWEDFEHLIREVFEKEFSTNGGEVKVTQASRDGGVDAIAFDPDPIRGGKIVIQAKRYTNTVSVSAVRDLYGTVMNEGATKGILVTTADYGPDAYEFAKNKPITLMNGSNLLYLLEKHGSKARIDIKEAKEFLNG